MKQRWSSVGNWTFTLTAERRWLGAGQKRPRWDNEGSIESAKKSVPFRKGGTTRWENETGGSCRGEEKKRLASKWQNVRNVPVHRPDGVRMCRSESPSGYKANTAISHRRTTSRCSTPVRLFLTSIGIFVVLTTGHCHVYTWWPDLTSIVQLFRTCPVASERQVSGSWYWMSRRTGRSFKR